jgi:uncharacterized protein (TIGR02265 family)
MHMEATLNQTKTAWGTRPISVTQAEDFAAQLPFTAAERGHIARTLHDFQPDGMVRGMFFISLRGALMEAMGEAVANSVLTRHGIGERFVPFSLYPHRDFYRFWFAAIPRAHPGRSVADGIKRIAETYFPVFLDSSAGRTMAALLLGSDPLTIVRRLRDAYSISVPHNQHKVEEVSKHHLRWHAVVEPSHYYVEAFVGIMRGAMECQRAPMPDVKPEMGGAVGKHHQRIVFDLQW